MGTATGAVEAEHAQQGGAHYRLPHKGRTRILAHLTKAIHDAWAGTEHQPIVSLCKEPRNVKQACGLDHNQCNCR